MEKNSNFIISKQNKIDILLFTIIGLSITGLLWFAAHFILWANENKIELFIYPLIFGILFTMFEVQYLPKISILKKYLKIQLIIGLLGQLLSNYLVYVSLHSIGPEFLQFSNPEYQVSTNWINSDDYIMNLLGMWQIFTFLLVIPATFSLLIHSKRSGDIKSSLKQSWHVSFIVMGILLGLRVGSSWSMHFYLLIYGAVILPFITHYSNEINISEEKYLSVRMPLIPMLGFVFMGVFWISMIEAQQAPNLSGNWLWFATAIIHLLLLLFKKRLNHTLLLGIWILTSIGMIFIALSNLIYQITLLRALWLVFGVLGSGLLLDMLFPLMGENKKFPLLHVFLGCITAFLGLIFPLLVNIFDPISSYLFIGFAIANIVMTVPYSIKK